MNEKQTKQSAKIQRDRQTPLRFGERRVNFLELDWVDMHALLFCEEEGTEDEDY